VHIDTSLKSDKINVSAHDKKIFSERAILFGHPVPPVNFITE